MPDAWYRRWCRAHKRRLLIGRRHRGCSAPDRRPPRTRESGLPALLQVATVQILIA
jgi:hypothetical protein